MAAFPQYAAGQRLTAGLLQSGQTNVLLQVADQTNATATLVSSPDLVVPVVANGTYIFHLRASYSAVVAADVQFKYLGPAGTTYQRYTFGVDTLGATDFTTTTTSGLTVTMQRRSATSGISGGTGIASFAWHLDSSIVRVGGTAGVVQLQFAQNTANATGTILRADSMIEYYRIA